MQYPPPPEPGQSGTNFSSNSQWEATQIPTNYPPPWQPSEQPPQGYPAYAPPPPQWPQPVPPTPKKRRTGLWIALGVIGGLVIISLVTCGIIGLLGARLANSVNNAFSTPATILQTTTSDQTTPVDQTTPASQTTPSSSSGTNTVGNPVVVDSTWTVTVNSAKTSSGDSVFTPKNGNTYLIVDVTVKNTSASNQTVSSLIFFSLKDSTGQQYDQAFTDIGKSPDGTLAPGETLRGQLVYEVPTSQNSFTLSFQADFQGTDLTEWAIIV